MKRTKAQNRPLKMRRDRKLFPKTVKFSPVRSVFKPENKKLKPKN